jgi:hypothetical protein
MPVHSWGIRSLRVDDEVVDGGGTISVFFDPDRNSERALAWRVYADLRTIEVPPESGLASIVSKSGDRTFTGPVLRATISVHARPDGTNRTRYVNYNGIGPLEGFEPSDMVERRE